MKGCARRLSKFSNAILQTYRGLGTLTFGVTKLRSGLQKLQTIHIVWILLYDHQNRTKAVVWRL